jgi:hypothetical protein
MVTPGTSALAERPAPENRQKLKGRNIMTDHNSRLQDRKQQQE